MAQFFQVTGHVFFETTVTLPRSDLVAGLGGSCVTGINVDPSIDRRTTPGIRRSAAEKAKRSFNGVIPVLDTESSMISR